MLRGKSGTCGEWELRLTTLPRPQPAQDVGRGPEVTEMDVAPQSRWGQQSSGPGKGGDSPRAVTYKGVFPGAK